MRNLFFSFSFPENILKIKSRWIEPKRINLNTSNFFYFFKKYNVINNISSLLSLSHTYHNNSQDL